jgi:myo-inositol-1(or 4)-monophosphatase
MTVDDRCSIEELKAFGIQTIRKLGEEALCFYGKGNPKVKFDENLVTTAELHLLDCFQNYLSSAFPDHQVFNQDQAVGSDYSHEGKRYLWIFDPIDGVDNFQTGIPIWGMSIALLENFWPIFGTIFMPATDDLFHAEADGRAFHGKKAISIPAQDNVDDESVLLTYSRFHMDYQPSFPGKIRNLGCTGAHICYVAMGRADAAVVANESYQDLAAARVIIEAAGGKIYKMDRSDFFLNEYLDGNKIADHLVVTADERFRPIRSCLNRVSR